MKRRLVLTGGLGFIGGHTVREIIAASEHDPWEILVIDDGRHACGRPLPEGVELASVDIADAAAADAVARFKPTAVLHLAAQGGLIRSWRDPVRDAETNVLGTINMLTASDAAGCRRFVMASSGGALYGDTDRIPAPEDLPPAPRTPYGTAKLTAEHYMGTFSRIRGVATVALRYGNVFGPWQDGTGEAGVVAISSERLIRGENVVMRGDGEQTRDFVFVSDVARANAMALVSDVTGPFNIGTGRETSVKRILDALCAFAGRPGAIEQVDLPQGEVRRSCLDVNRAKSELSWEALTDIETGCEQTYAWFVGRDDASNTKGAHADAAGALATHTRG